jgi:hypothetical protein
MKWWMMVPIGINAMPAPAIPGRIARMTGTGRIDRAALAQEFPPPLMVAQDLMNAVTDFGDSGLLLPLSAVFLIALRRYQPGRVVWGWVVALALCLCGMAAAKLVGGVCGHAVLSGIIVSPSGHTAFSTFFYGSLALVIARQAGALGGRLTIVAAILLVGAIAATRIGLHAHSKPEVLIGLLVGLAAVSLFRNRLHGAPPARIITGPVIATALLVTMLAYGHRLQAEEVLKHVAAQFRHSSGVCGG